MLTLLKPSEDMWMSRNEWYHFAVEAIERALISPDAALEARPLKVPEKTLLQELAQLAGITISDSIIKEKTLKDLGLGDSTLYLISNLLKHKYNIYYDEEKLSTLTVKRVNDLDNVVRKSEFDKLEGLSQFINYVETDELLGTTDIVSVPTLVTGTDLKDEFFDPTKNCLFILPGLEGLHERFRELCGRLKIRAVVLQPGLDNPNENLQDLAKKYAKVLLKNAESTGHFYLMGYESGTAVALEVAGILEDNGLTGTVFCLGCTVEDFQKTLKEALKMYQTEDELRDAVLYHIYKLLADDDSSDLIKALKNTHTRQDKVEACVRMLLGREPLSAQYVRELIETVFTRIVEVQKYRVTERRLRSKIVYLRAAGYSDSGLAALQRHSEHPLVVHQLSAPLPHATLDLRCAAVINDCLPREILDEYDNGYICDIDNFIIEK